MALPLPPFMVPPPCMELKESLVAKETQGVFCKEAISIDTKFGPFVGEIIPGNELDRKQGEIDFRYAWHVSDRETSEVLHVVNATVPEKGNWMRYVNSARFYEEQNIVSVQEGTEIYYKALKDIKPGEELLTWFDLIDMKKSRKRKRGSQRSASATEPKGASELNCSIGDTESTGNGKRLRKKKVSTDMLSVDDHDVIFASSGLHHNWVKNSSGNGLRRSSSVSVSKVTPSQKIDVQKSKIQYGSKLLTSTSQQTVSTSQQTSVVGISESKTTLLSSQVLQPSVKMSSKGIKRPKTILQIVDALKSAKNESGGQDVTSSGIIFSDTKDTIKGVSAFTGVKQPKRSHLVGTAEFMEEHMTTNCQFLFEVTLEHKSVPKDALKRFRYACDICEGQYRKPINLKRHYLREHLNHKYLSPEDVSLLNHKTDVSADKVEADVDPDADDQDSSESLFDPTDKMSDTCDVANDLQIKKEALETSANDTNDGTEGESNKEVDIHIAGSDVSVPRSKTSRVALEKSLTSKPLEGKTTFSYSGIDGVNDAFRCHLCVQLFSSVEKLKYHLTNDSHRSKVDKQFSCDRCSQRFRFRYNYQRHIESHGAHTNELSTACHICGKKFMNEANMRKHLRFHSGRNFPCKYGCDVVYPNVAELVKHLRAFHPNLPKRSQLTGANSTNITKKSPGQQQKELPLTTTKAPLSGEAVIVQVHEVSPPAWSGVKEHKSRPGVLGVQCPVCKKKFSTYGSMARHRRAFHRLAKQTGNVEKAESPADSSTAVAAEENVETWEDPSARISMHIEANVERLYKAIEEEQAMKEAEERKLVFSPPASPTTFYQNVADNVAENLACYLDGGSEALEKAHQYIKVDDYIPMDQARDIKSDVQIDWTMYNFPPFFMPVDPVIPYPPSLPQPPPNLKEGFLDGEKCPAYTTRSAVAEREATWRASIEAVENFKQREKITRRASVGALDQKSSCVEKIVRRASVGSFDSKTDTEVDDKKMRVMDDSITSQNLETNTELQKELSEATQQNTLSQSAASSAQETETMGMKMMAVEKPVLEDNLCQRTSSHSQGLNEVFKSSNRGTDNCMCASAVQDSEDTTSLPKETVEAKRDVERCYKESLSSCKHEEEKSSLSSEKGSDVSSSSASEQTCELSSENSRYGTDKSSEVPDKGSDHAHPDGVSDDLPPKADSKPASTNENFRASISGDLSAAEQCDKLSVKSDMSISHLKSDDEPRELVSQSADSTSKPVIKDDSKIDISGDNSDSNMNSQLLDEKESVHSTQDVDSGVSQKLVESTKDEEISAETGNDGAVVNSEKTEGKTAIQLKTGNCENVNMSTNTHCIQGTNQEQCDVDSEDTKGMNKVEQTAAKAEHTMPMMIGRQSDNSAPSSEYSNLDLSEKELEYLSKGIVLYVRGNKKSCPHVTDTPGVAVRQPENKDEEEYLNTLQLTTRKIKAVLGDSSAEVVDDKMTVEGLKSGSLHGKCLDRILDSQKKIPSESVPNSVCETLTDQSSGPLQTEDLNKTEQETPSEEQKVPAEGKNSEPQISQPDSSVLMNDDSTTDGQSSKPKSSSDPAELEDDSDELDLELLELQTKIDMQIHQERIAIDQEAEEMCKLCQSQNTEFGEPSKRTADDFAKMQFGRKYPVYSVCSLCRRYYHGVDSLLRHQVKKHPSFQCSHIEVENGHGLERLFYPEPSTQGVLAESVLLPPQTLNQDSYTCTRCKLTVKQYSRLRAHILNCDPKTPTTPHTRKKKPRANRHRFMEKMLPDAGSGNGKVKEFGGAVRDLSFKPKGPGGAVGLKGKTLPSTSRTYRPIHSSLKKESGSSCSSQPGGRASTPTRTRVPSWKVAQSQLSTSTNKSDPAPGKAGRARRCRNYELLYNPAAHVRRRERTDCVDIHQCQGCRLSFRTISLLERHTKNCSGKDKILSQKPVANKFLEGHGAKKHSCHYCPKRFKYLKGVYNHYNNNFCRVRGERLSGEGLTAEDLAHEQDLQARLQQQAWHKMENRDHTDVIQGRAHLHDDGTITHTKRKGGWPKGLKRSSKRRCNGWTYIKRRKPDGNSNETTNSPSKSKSASSLKSAVCSNSAVSVAMSELEAKLREPITQSVAEKRKRPSKDMSDLPEHHTSSQIDEPDSKKGKSSKTVDDLSQAPVIDRMDTMPPIRDSKQMSLDLEPPTLSPIPSPDSPCVTLQDSNSEKKKGKRKAADSLRSKKTNKKTDKTQSGPVKKESDANPPSKQQKTSGPVPVPVAISQPIIAPQVNLGEGVTSPIFFLEPVTDASGTKGGQLKLVQLKIPTVVPRILSQSPPQQSEANAKTAEKNKSCGTSVISNAGSEQEPLPFSILLPSPSESSLQQNIGDLHGKSQEEKSSDLKDMAANGKSKSLQKTEVNVPQNSEEQTSKSRKGRSRKKTGAASNPAQATIKDIFKIRRSPTRCRTNTLKNMQVYRYEKCPISSSATASSVKVSLSAASTTSSVVPSTVAPPTTSVSSLLPENGMAVLPPGAMLAVLSSAPVLFQPSTTSGLPAISTTSQAKTTTTTTTALQTAVAEGKIVFLDPRSLSSLVSVSSLPMAASVAPGLNKGDHQQTVKSATVSPAKGNPGSQTDSSNSSVSTQMLKQEMAKKDSASKQNTTTVDAPCSNKKAEDIAAKHSVAKNSDGKKNATKDNSKGKEKEEKDNQVEEKMSESTTTSSKSKQKPKRGPPPSSSSPNGGKVKSMTMMTSPGVHTMVSLNVPSTSKSNAKSTAGDHKAGDSSGKGDSSGESHKTAAAENGQETRTRPTRAAKLRRNQTVSVTKKDSNQDKDNDVCGNGHTSKEGSVQDKTGKQSKRDSGSDKGSLVLKVPVIEKRGDQRGTSPYSEAEDDLPLSHLKPATAKTAQSPNKSRSKR